MCAGTGESGKSTFIKQMRIIHGSGYSKQDREQFRDLVFRNICTAMHALTSAMGQLQIPYQSEEAARLAQELHTIREEEAKAEIPKHATAVRCVWRDVGIQKCYQHRRAYQLSDSAK